MRVEFKSRAELERLVYSGILQPGSRWDIISISDSNCEKRNFRNFWLDHKREEGIAALFLNFQDTDDLTSGFTPAKARQIVRFASETVRKEKDLLVHCWLGVSRSAAVAKWYSEYFGIDSPSLENYTLYNTYIYSKLVEYAENPWRNS